MKTKNYKEKYLVPIMEVIEVENEGVMAASTPTTISGFNDGGNMFSVGASRSRKSNVHQTASPLNDLEDILNDFFTVKK